MYVPAKLTRSEDLHKTLINWLIEWTKDQAGYLKSLKEKLINYFRELPIKELQIPITRLSSLGPDIFPTQETETPTPHESSVWRAFFYKANYIY